MRVKVRGDRLQFQNLVVFDLRANWFVHTCFWTRQGPPERSTWACEYRVLLCQPDAAQSFKRDHTRS